MTPTAPLTELESITVRKLFWRLLPFLFLLYIVAYLDRINVSFAALQMREQLAGKTVVGVLSGGNLDLRLLAQLLGGSLNCPS